MVAGWDKSGPNLFYVDSEGTRLKSDLFSVGSGSIYAYGVCQQMYWCVVFLYETLERLRGVLSWVVC